ncbi:MAG: glycoside hydrolase family 57 protein [Gammaproteobacteria bacterium]|nr:glycoside hydrolase family 57 protein [Gammaproteobacteria bacterium]MCW8911020.1 glycoside hydrolase family 57 protein [Gammaproteobacteria bacterium]MCW9006266.1 glycoside hydrolase family 57 protein [Gammaproteobacteria bacterium]MCW9056499.1 glycoside hydrolase family 57 protein [Gammaproteobacteria bacterium]
MSDEGNKKTHPLNVVIYWHMHQPEYRDLRNGQYHLPWTYLHTIKDYVDMAAHLENNVDARAVVNFAPVLLEQIDDYAKQLDSYLNHGRALRDPLLSALADPVLSPGHEIRLHIINACLRANKERLIDRFEVFKTLSEMAETALKQPEILSYYSEQFFADLLVWYHLAWTAETVRNTDVRIQKLMNKAEHFSVHDRHLLVEVINELVSGVIGRYRKLAEQGRIELSMTPYAHPIVPLLLDIKATEQAMPNADLPIASEYPGGEDRSRWHMQKGIAVFKNYFGFEPQGCWPSEGSISAEAVELISEMGIKWLASGETVLRNSLEKSEISADPCIHQAYQYREANATCFFRDDALSDLIGFKYSDWHADDAVANLEHHLETIASSCANKPDAIVSIILDGENAWEHYPDNGFHFISALYEKLGQNRNLKLTTYSEYLDSYSNRAPLNEIVAGSWVYGTFSTWIGEKDKNRAWDMLVEAKKVYDKVITEGKLSPRELEIVNMQMATCESSDWFWWFGEYNSAESVAAFDEQYRLHLCNLYQLLKVEPPEYLAKAFSFGSGDPVMGGTMLPGQHH